MDKSLMDGNEAIAWGAYYSGCGFFAGYPITPATGIFSAMLKLIPPAGGYVLQAEDEIASMGYCLGASMAGLKAMTATSGPGLSLYSEHISFALGSEIPLVIVDVQRLGPSTGSATRGADGDIMFMRWGCSGGLPVIVLAPVDVKDCLVLTMNAFNLAERLRCPVLIASNKEIALTRESVDIDALAKPDVTTRAAPSNKLDYKPFHADPETGVPWFLPIGGDVIVRQTSSTHGASGYITTDAAEISAGLDRMKRKIEERVEYFSYHQYFPDKDAETLIITYGVTARAAAGAVKRLKKAKRRAGLLILKTIWPSLEKVIKEAARDYNDILVVEMNLGQYAFEIQRILKDKDVRLLQRMDGLLVTPEQIMDAVG